MVKKIKKIIKDKNDIRTIIWKCDGKEVGRAYFGVS
jgi:hypothetical protein